MSQPPFAASPAMLDVGRLLRESVQLHQQGRLAEARRGYETILKLQPKHPDAMQLLGFLLHQQGDTVGGLPLMQRSLKIQPSPSVAYNLGSAFQSLGQWQEAAQAFALAAKLKPDFLEAWISLGNTQRQRGKLQDAIGFYLRAANIQPTGVVLGSIAQCLSELGDMAQATDYLERALALTPNDGKLWRLLSVTSPFRNPEDPRLAKMQVALAQTQSEEDKIQLGFALGKAYDDLKQPDTAFGYFVEANRLRRRQYADYTTDAARAVFQRIMKAYPALPESYAGKAAEKSSKALFVLGMPRSGTSLVEQILASHSQVFGAGELETIRELTRKYVPNDPDAFPERFASMPLSQLQEMGRDYLAHLDGLAPKARYVIDKMPGNFPFIGLIQQTLPHAKIIHCRRNPMDTCLSLYKHDFTGKHPYAYDLKELGEYYLLYEAIMAHWRTMLPADKFYEISYEALIADQESETRKLLDFCGLEWQDACLAFHQTQREVRTASKSQVRQPIYQNAVGAAKQYGEHLLPLMEGLGIAHG